MPYIKTPSRELYNDLIGQLANKVYENTEGFPNTPWNNGFFKGDLNYIFFRLVRQFQRQCEYEGKDFGYQELSDVVGALRDCAAEYERRFVQPYEDKKIKENGDV